MLRFSIFYLTSLIIVSKAITKHRDAGGHNSFGSNPPSYNTPNASYGIQPQQNNTYPQYPPVSYQPYGAQPSTQQELDLKSQNIALQQQYLQLQQQHVDLLRQSQVGSPDTAALRTASPEVGFEQRDSIRM
jgi:hypothetical protein